MSAETVDLPSADVLVGLDLAINLVRQSLESLRWEDDGESRTIRTSIAAREHVIGLLTGYRGHLAKVGNHVCSFGFRRGEEHESCPCGAVLP